MTSLLTKFTHVLKLLALLSVFGVQNPVWCNEHEKNSISDAPGSQRLNLKQSALVENVRQAVVNSDWASASVELKILAKTRDLSSFAIRHAWEHVLNGKNEELVQEFARIFCIENMHQTDQATRKEVSTFLIHRHCEISSDSAETLIAAVDDRVAFFREIIGRFKSSDHIQIRGAALILSLKYEFAGPEAISHLVNARRIDERRPIMQNLALYFDQEHPLRESLSGENREIWDELFEANSAQLEPIDHSSLRREGTNELDRVSNPDSGRFYHETELGDDMDSQACSEAPTSDGGSESCDTEIFHLDLSEDEQECQIDLGQLLESELDTYIDHSQQGTTSSESIIHQLILQQVTQHQRLIESAQESTESMIHACIQAIEDINPFLFFELIRQAGDLLDYQMHFAIISLAIETKQMEFIQPLIGVQVVLDSPVVSAKAKSILISRKNSRSLAQKLVSLQWRVLDQDELTQLTEQVDLEVLTDELEQVLSYFLSSPENPPYNQRDFEVLDQYLSEMISRRHLVFLSATKLRDACNGWAERLRGYGIPASMSTRS